MAQEITINMTLTATKQFLSLSRIANVKIDMAGTHYGVCAQAIGTTQEALAINSDIATNGVTWLRNLDATNYIEVGVVVSATFYPLLKLKAGEAQVIRLATGVTAYAKANTATAILEHAVLED
jgi:hypothetical protein